jgi:hypothetical protein
MESRNVRITKSEAIDLSRRGSFVGNPTMSASKHVRGAFGEGLVRGWLVFHGYKIRDRPLLIRAGDFGLDVFPSLRRFRLIEIVTTNETLAVEVKTYGSHCLQGASGDTLEDQLTDALRWRKLSPGRILALAVVNYYGRPVISKSDLGFIRANRIPILRFVIRGMSG